MSKKVVVLLLLVTYFLGYFSANEDVIPKLEIFDDLDVIIIYEKRVPDISLRYFQSLDDLIGFLSVDDTNEIEYDFESFVCHDFTLRMIGNAREQGYNMSYMTLSFENLIEYQNDVDNYIVSLGWIVSGPWGVGDRHAVVRAYIEEIDEYVIIEPQLDIILRYNGERYIGVYRGEVR